MPDERTIETPSQTYYDLEDNRLLCRDLMLGTEHMRDQRTTYLPIEEGESDSAYDARMARTFLYNGFGRTVKSHAGKVFDRPVQLEAPEPVLDWAENITNEGRSLTVFGRDLLRRVLSEGITFIQVEYPNVPQTLTKADERQLKIRPYMIEVPPEKLFWWSWQTISGVPVVTEVRIRESYMADDGGESEQIRVLKPGNWEIWRQNDNGDWVNAESGTTAPIRRVPIIPVYANRTGVYQSDPPMRDLADLNLAHWQSMSDQRHILHVARVPILFGAGLAEDMQRLVIGPNRMVKSNNPAARLSYVEHSGAAIEAGRQDLEDLERRMGVMGLELLMPSQPGTVTATERAIDKAESESALQMIARNLQNALENALLLMMEWGGVSGEVEVDINSSFEIKISDTQELQSLLDMRTAGDLSRDSLWLEMKRRGVLRDDFDPDQEKTDLEAEGPPAPKMNPLMMAAAAAGRGGGDVQPGSDQKQ